MRNIREWLLPWFLAVLILSSVAVGFFTTIDGAKNIALFVGWTHGIIGTLLAIAAILIMAAADDIEEAWKRIVKERAKKEKPFHLPWLLDVSVDAFALLTYVWHGHWVLGIFFLIASISHLIYRNAVENYLFEKLKEGFSG